MAKPSDKDVQRWRKEAIEAESRGLAPNYDLAPLKVYPREVLLIGEKDSDELKDLKRLTLTLALVYNDLKDLDWAHEFLAYWALPPDQARVPTPYLGQHRGMTALFVRHACGVVAELDHVLHAKRDFIKSKAFAAATQALQGRTKALEAWQQLLADFEHREPAPNEKHAPASKVIRCIDFIRNKAAYHYGHERWENLVPLSEAYAKHFDPTKEHPHLREVAFASLGENTERTRFYFADAAVGQVTLDALAKHDVNTDEIWATIYNIWHALRFVVESLLNSLAGSPPKVYEPSPPAGQR
jgi:hypothetical protein